MKKRRNLTAAVCICLLAALGTGVTLGYLHAEQEVVNIFTVGDLKLGLREPEWDPDGGDGKQVCPGYSAYKNPTIKNITSVEGTCYVRMCIRICDENGKDMTDSQALSLIKSTIRYDDTYSGTYEQKGTGSKITEGRIPGYTLEELEKLPMINPLFSVDEKRSRENRIVCNYMGPEKTGIFKTGEEAVLFTDIAVPTQWENKEMELVGDFRIIVSAEAIQTAGFADQEQAFLALDGETEGEENP